MGVGTLAAQDGPTTTRGTPGSGTGSIAVRDGVERSFSQVVSDTDGAVDTLAEIAAALAAAVNVDAPAAFAATAEAALGGFQAPNL